LVALVAVLALPLLLLLATRQDASGSKTPDFFKVGSYYKFTTFYPGAYLWVRLEGTIYHYELSLSEPFKVLEIGNDGWLLVEFVLDPGRIPPDHPPALQVWVNTAQFVAVLELEKPN
jgi:hypothetical protein